MPELVVAEATAARLRALAAEHVLPEPLSTRVVRGVHGTLDGASAADVSVPHKALVRLPHAVLADVAAWARDVRPEDESLKLVRLLQGSRLYHPPPPVYERPRELDESLDAIRRAQEQQEYERMTSTAKPGPAAPYTVRTAGPSEKHALLEERRAWRETRSQLSATANIMLSMLAVAVAAWWSGGTADATWKTLVALALAAVMGIAEYALYARYWRVTEQRRQRRVAKH